MKENIALPMYLNMHIVNMNSVEILILQIF